MQGPRIQCAFAVLACASIAHADSLADAKAQVASSDYLNARASLDAAHATGTNSPEQLAEVWRLRGIVAGALNETKASTEAFQRCLALTPNAELPPGSSPKFARPFAAAQDFMKKQAPLKIRQSTTASPPSIVVAIDSDPMKMIARIVVDVKVDGKDDKRLEAKHAGQDQIELSLPQAARLDLRVTALDEKGNRLAELGSAEVPIVIVGQQPPVDKKPEVAKPRGPGPVGPVRERPLHLKWWLWGGGAVVFAGVATYFGIDGLVAKSDLEDLNARSSNHSFDEAKSLENRARRDFLLSNIGYGVAGALAITATILYLTEPDRPAEHAGSSGQSPRRLTAVPLEGGGAIVLGGQF